MARAARGEPHWIVPAEEMAAIHEARTPERPIQEIIEKWLRENEYQHGGAPTTAQIIADALRMDPSRLTDRLTRDEVRLCMKKLGWRDTTVHSHAMGRSIRAWSRDA
jgi:hypothetical protein